MTLEFLAKNYKKGDPFPIRNDSNVMRVYNFQLCPYVERVLLVLEAKQVKYETINVNLGPELKPEWLYEKHPQAKVPAIEFDSDNKILFESLVISDFIDEQYSDKRPLRSTDPYQRALDRLFIDNFSEFESNYGKIFHTNDELSDIWNGVNQALKKLETNFSKRRTQKYLSDDSKPGMTDYMIWPFIERIPSTVAFLSNTNYSEYLEKELPVINDYRNEMLKDIVVSKLLTCDDIFHAFHEIFKNRLMNS